MFFLPLLWLSAVAAFPEDDALYYCHTGLKWPTPPKRDSQSSVDRVVAFIRHGSRVLTHNQGCWEGDQATYSCSSQTYSGYERLEDSFSPKFLRVRGDLGALRGNCILGQLVDSGIDMQLANGKVLREAYGDPLHFGTVPKNSEIMIRADDCSRTIESAEALTLGIFPGGNNGNHTAFEVVVPDRAIDGMEPNKDVCPALSSAEEDFYRSNEAKQHAKKSRKFREKIGKITGRSDAWSDDDPRNLAERYSKMLDCLMSHACPTVPSEPKNLPEGLEVGGELWQHVINEATFWRVGRYEANSELLDFAVGPLIRDMIDDLTTDGRKFSLYSGHDTGPMGEMLSALGLRWEDSGRLCASVWPAFGSMLVFEIYSDNLGRFVYNGRIATADAIPECMGKSVCNVTTVLAYLRQFVPDELTCRSRDRFAVENFASIFWPAAFGLLVGLLFSGACYIFLARKKRSSKWISLEEGQALQDSVH